ncbi:MAG: YceI family protein [Calditrichota bacterium]
MKNLYILFSIFILTGFLQAGEWHVNTSAKNMVKFTSSVTVLTFDGTTDKVDGYLYWEGDEMFKEKSQVYIEVDLNSVETGIGKRDRDMRDVLNTAEHPATTFSGTFSNATPVDGMENAWDVTVEGKFSVNGTEKEISVPGKITMEDGQMRVVADFMILLDDYNIEAPSIAAFIKVAQEIKLHLDFYLKEHKGEE